MELLSTPNGPYVCITRAGGELLPGAEMRFREAALSGAELLYADEAYRADGEKAKPFYKPDWSPQTLLSVNCIGCPIVVKQSLFFACGGARLLPDGRVSHSMEGENALYVFTLRAAFRARGVLHIPDILHCGPPPQTLALTDSVREALLSAGCVTEAEEGLYPGSFSRRYGLRADSRLAVIVSCADGEADALHRTLTRIESARGAVQCRFTVAHEPVFAPRIRDMLQALADEKQVKCVCADADGNRARLFNLAAQEAHADALLFVHAGAYPLRVETLERMLTLALLPGSGAIGGKLLNAEGRLQSAVLVCGVSDAPLALFRGTPDTAENPLQNRYTNCIRNVTALGGALMLSAERFFALAGFDETLPTEGFMEELCVRLTDHKLHNVFTPYALWRGAEKEARPLSRENRERMRDVFFRYRRAGDGMFSRNPAVLRRLQKLDEF